MDFENFFWHIRGLLEDGKVGQFHSFLSMMDQELKRERQKTLHIEAEGKKIQNTKRIVDLNGLNFTGIDLTNIAFISEEFKFDLSHSNFVNAVLHDGSFSDTILNDCNFTGTNISLSRFPQLAMKKCNFTHAHISDSEFFACDMEDGDFRMAEIHACDFTWCNMHNVAGLDMKPCEGERVSGLVVCNFAHAQNMTQEFQDAYIDALKKSWEKS